MIPFPSGPLPAPAQGESSADFVKRLLAASGPAGMANWVARVHAAAGISPPFQPLSPDAILKAHSLATTPNFQAAQASAMQPPDAAQQVGPGNAFASAFGPSNPYSVG